MKRPLYTIIAFILCLAVVLAGMSWVTWTALRLEREQAEAQRQAALEENVRLALWRMDSALVPLIARESARPYFAYQSAGQDGNAANALERINAPGTSFPTGSLEELPPRILLHFQFEPNDIVTSPQVSKEVAQLSDMLNSTGKGQQMDQAVVNTRRLGKLKGLTSQKRLLEKLPQKTDPNIIYSEGKATFVEPSPPTAQQQMEMPQKSSLGHRQITRGVNEAQQRAWTLDVAQSSNVFSNAAVFMEARMTAMHPLWVDSNFLLARRVTVAEKTVVQGCWLDWPEIKQWLLGNIHDLLPEADLVPITDPEREDESRMLVALPLRLIPGAIPMPVSTGRSPIAVSLIIAWACVLLSAAAVAILLWGTVLLSERRGAFVSAVTHELRTPLTTFRMYTELLSEGMVAEEKRKKYLGTLRTEADRLGHLVENVLSYARLERTRTRRELETVALGAIVERAKERLAARAEQAGMALVVEDGDAWHTAEVRVDLSALEQILFNLVDNACKYASSTEDKRIHIEASNTEDRAVIRIRDHGPGILPGDAKRLFRPFCKSAKDAANSAPGVGLGLALSRRLARRMGGDLRIGETPGNGAVFEVTLPIA